MSAAPAPPRTDRGRRRREAVLDAAAELFYVHGFHGVSVDDLGHAAGITGPGLYRHFASKDALLMAVLDQVWGALRPALDTASALPASDALEPLLAAHLDLVVGQPTALVLLASELRHLPGDYRDRARRNHRRYLDAWVRAIVARHPSMDDAVARTTALAVHGLLDSAALARRVELAPPDPVVERAQLERLAHAAVAGAAG